MKTLRNITLGLLTLVTLALAPVSQAQFNVEFPTLTTPATLNVGVTSTNTTMYLTNGIGTITVRGLNVVIQPQFSLYTTGTSPTVWTFDESADNSHWTSGTRTITITANGTNVVSGAANFIVGAMPYLRLSGVTNPNASAITNIVVKYVFKY